MGYSISRLTLYATISSIENDLRQVIVNYLDSEYSPLELLGDDLFDIVQQRAEKDMREINDNSSLELCLAYIDFTDAYHLINSYGKHLPEYHRKYVKKITPHLDKISPIRNRVMHSRPLQHEDLSFTLDTCQQFVQENPDEFWENLKETLSRLESEPSFVLGLEIPAYFGEYGNQNHNLPIPDFDETGFVGRKQLVKTLTKQCLGPYPVISVIGEGGLGKTALALKVAYDILDLPDCPFDAVVWSSSKTMQLTPTEIMRIEGAIFDSLGIFNAVATNLAGEMYEDPIEEVLEYLEQFRILLILDNLETILDDRIREFLSRLPSGSKILITSRIGLGAFEIPIKLMPLDTSESTSLLRAVAKIRGVSKLVKMPNKKLETYCEQMQNNPGYIKWFVSAVQAGIRPEEALQDSGLFLEFCMSNVYDYLETNSKELLTAMMCVPGKHSQAELAFLTKKPVVELQKALQQLLTTNMIIMVSSPTGSSFTSHYELGDLPRDYLQHYHPPSTEVYTKYTKQRKRLVASEEQARANQKTRPYSPFSIVTRSTGDFVVARYLQKALSNAHKEKFNDANSEIRQAKSLAPEYFEVHRVDAWIKVAQKNITAAQTAYESAIELEPNHAPLLYWYSNFLLRYLGDASRALVELKQAYQLDPKSFEIQFDMARATLYTMNYEEAQSILENILDSSPNMSDKDTQKVYDLYLQAFQRQAEQQQRLGDFESAVQSITKMKEVFEKIPTQLVDAYIREKLYKGLQIGIQIAEYVEGKMLSMIQGLNIWLSNVSNNQTLQREINFTSDQGKIVKMVTGEFYGFILMDKTGERIFFHRNDLYDFGEWDELENDVRVAFSISENHKGPCAVGVRRLETE